LIRAGSFNNLNSLPFVPIKCAFEICHLQLRITPAMSYRYFQSCGRSCQLQGLVKGKAGLGFS
jgi:hypothetical protein